MTFSFSPPQILTRALLPSLLQQLDASDVVESYALLRSAPLHQPEINSTVLVQKIALGLRYRPPTSSHKRPLELTLEYGPQRNGESWLQDAMPFVSGDYITWENEGHVYVTKSIGDEWNQAYYVASITGAVLGKLLDRAIGYTNLHGRYQPFSVMQQDKLVLKSSSALDFVQAMWEDLAKVGVLLNPILPPPMYSVVLHVDAIVKVSGYQPDGTLTSTHASQWFEKLSACVTALATGDFSDYTPTVSPTSLPSQSPSQALPTSSRTLSPSSTPSLALERTLTLRPTPTISPTVSPTWTMNITTTTIPTIVTNDTKYPNMTLHNTTIQPGATQHTNTTTLDRNTTKKEDSTTDPLLPHNTTVTTTSRHNTTTTTTRSIHNDTNHIQPNNTLRRLFQDFPEFEPETVITKLPTVVAVIDNTAIPDSDEAAQDAVSAAVTNKNESSSETTQKAADAAEAAVVAAEKAAEATAHTAYQQWKGYITSGDGTLVPTAVRQCFVNPQYGIGSGSGSDSSPTAVGYLYLDGSFYYQLHLIEPYLSVVQLHRPLPQPPSFTNSSINGGDFIDWTLAIAIGVVVVLGILMIFQQIGIRIFFHKSQKNFFRPLALEKDDEVDDHIRGQDHFNSFAQDVIPWSMSGKGASSPHGRSSKVVVSVFSMVAPLAPPELELVESRFHRDPDLVDLPHLRSRSKVAIPASMDHRTTSFHSDTSDPGSDNEDLFGSPSQGNGVFHLT